MSYNYTLTLLYDLSSSRLFKNIYFARIICCITFICTGSAKPFFLKKALKKLLNNFSNFFFYLKVQYFRLIMENNFSQMAASAGHAVAYTMGPIFKHIIDYIQLYFTNGFTNIVLQNDNCLQLVGVTIIFDSTPQILVQWCQIAAPR